MYPQIYLGSVGNSVYDQQSDRAESLSSSLFTVDMELSHAITTTDAGWEVEQDQGAGVLIKGNLKEQYSSDTNITFECNGSANWWMRVSNGHDPLDPRGEAVLYYEETNIPVNE